MRRESKKKMLFIAKKREGWVGKEKKRREKIGAQTKLLGHCHCPIHCPSPDLIDMSTCLPYPTPPTDKIKCESK